MNTASSFNLSHEVDLDRGIERSRRRFIVGEHVTFQPSGKHFNLFRIFCPDLDIGPYEVVSIQELSADTDIIAAGHTQLLTIKIGHKTERWSGQFFCAARAALEGK